MGKPHHNLEVWKRSLNYVTGIYKITANFPADEKFGLVSQMRRAAVSIPSNIAEGAARNSKKEFITCHSSLFTRSSQLFFKLVTHHLSLVTIFYTCNYFLHLSLKTCHS